VYGLGCSSLARDTYIAYWIRAVKHTPLYGTRYRVDAAALAALRKIKEDLKLGAAAALVRTEPDSPECMSFLNQTFELGDTPAFVTEPRAQRPEGPHRSHPGRAPHGRLSGGFDPFARGAPDSREVPAQFLLDFAHAAVEAGADVFVGHRPHTLRGIEIYKGKVIFYTLAGLNVKTFTRGSTTGTCPH
jgi:hypothetical protein